MSIPKRKKSNTEGQLWESESEMGITTMFSNFPISTISSNGHFSSAIIFTTKNFRFLPKQPVSAWNSVYQVERASDWAACFTFCWVCNMLALQSSSIPHYNSDLKRLRLTYSDTHVLRYLLSPTEKLGASRDEALEHCTGTGES
jgi:hypothetical protein